MITPLFSEYSTSYNVADVPPLNIEHVVFVGVIWLEGVVLVYVHVTVAPTGTTMVTVAPLIVTPVLVLHDRLVNEKLPDCVVSLMV